MTDKRAVLKQWLASGKASLHPLTFSQRELWETSPVPAADVANHICCFIKVRGPLTGASCEAAVQRVVDRQEALRLSILPGKERPVQLVRQAGEPSFRYRELSSAEARDEAVEEAAHAIFREPFDLVQGPLYRAEVLKRGPDNHVMVLAIHHAIADGWTLGVFVQDLCIAYAADLMGLKEGLDPVPMTYTAWGAAERALWTPAELEQRAGFWREHLAGRRRLWVDREGAEGAAGAPQIWIAHFPLALAEAARELARVTGTTLFNTLLAAFQVALGRWSGERDVIVGTPVANRTKEAVRETMGYFSGVVPLRGQVEEERPFAERLRTVHDTTVECFANAMPFAELVAALEEPVAPGRNPFYQVRFALQNHPVPDVSIKGLSAQLRMRSTGTARFQIACECTVVEEGLEVVWRYREKVFPQESVENLSRMFEVVLAGACRAPDSRISFLTT